MVTGVSTVAQQGTFAFLGARQYLGGKVRQSAFVAEVHEASRTARRLLLPLLALFWSSAAVPRPAAAPQRHVIYFETASARLTPEAFSLVRNVADLVRTHRPNCVRVVGHADTVGSRSYNRRLSKRRARNVAAELVSQSVAPTPVYVSWLGQSAPPVETPDEVPLPENRAAEILFTTCR